MKSRELNRLLNKIEEKAEAFKALRQHTNDPDLLRTAAMSLAHALATFIDAIEA